MSTMKETPQPGTAGGESPEDPNSKFFSASGALPDYAVAQIREQRLPPPIPKSPLELAIENRPSWNPESIHNSLLGIFKETSFSERGNRLQVRHDAIGLVRHLTGGHTETYSEKLAKEYAKNPDKFEVATYGVGEIDGQKLVMYALHWKFFAGSVGVVAGEKFKEAVDLSIKEDMPLVGVYSSSGVRQQENSLGLAQMTKMMQARNKYRKESKYPYVSVLLGQVWGGISASVVPGADLSVGLAGTNYGFSGPQVIESYEQKAPPVGAQSVETHTFLRNIDLVVQNDNELLAWMGKLMKYGGGKKGKLSLHDAVDLPPIEEMSQVERFRFGERGYFLPSISHHDLPTSGDVFQNIPVNTADLPERFNALQKDARRPDTEYLMKQCFDNFVPFYSPLSSEDKIENPALIAGLGKIDGQEFLVMGNMPMYQKVHDRIVKIPSSPTPRDFRWMQRMLAFGERLNLPLVLLTDTLGAKPTIEAEWDNQNGAISDTTGLTLTYGPPTIAVITGVLGSGGGIATTPLGDSTAMFENAMCFVSEPRSFTTILNSEANPSLDSVKRTINTARATAKDQMDMGFIDYVISEGHRNASEHPAVTAQNLRTYIIEVAIAEFGKSKAARMKAREKKINTLGQIMLKQGKLASADATFSL